MALEKQISDPYDWQSPYDTHTNKKDARTQYNRPFAWRPLSRYGPFARAGDMVQNYIYW